MLGVVSILLYMQKQNLKYAESIKFPPMQKEIAHLSTEKIIDIPLGEIKVNAKIFDLNKSLAPADLYHNIDCITSAKIIVQTTLCLHDLSKDVHVILKAINKFYQSKI